MARIEFTVAENVRRYQRFSVEVDGPNADLAHDIDDLSDAQVTRLLALANVVESERSEPCDEPETNVMVDALDDEQCSREYEVDSLR